MDPVIRVDSGIVTLFNTFTTEPADQPKLVEMLKEVTQNLFSKAKGFVSSSFHATKDGKQVITYSQWKSVEDVAAMRQIPAMAPYLQRIAALAKFEAATTDVVWTLHA
jgi:quinol monooxygenase YgiN